MGAVATKKVSVTLDADVLEEAREAARLRGMSLSAWLSDAAYRIARVEEGRRDMEEYQKEYGAFTEEERRRARKALGIIVLTQPGENDDDAGL